VHLVITGDCQLSTCIEFRTLIDFCNSLSITTTSEESGSVGVNETE
jgi:hypothetical protein